MSKVSRQHHADEFGQLPSRSIRGLDAPMIAAGSAIALDALVERESGITPPPPPVSIKTLAITFSVMFVAGVIGLLALMRWAPLPFPFHG